jgi:hypothetical protein
MNTEDFFRWFNSDFWGAFKARTFPIKIPQTTQERQALLERVYSSIATSRYAPIVVNKGHGVARTVPVFCVEDYCVYYFCIKELEDVLCGNRTDNTFGGWSLGGALRRQENNEIECELTEYGRYSFNPLAWTQAFGEWNALLFSQLDQGDYSHVLQFDLSNFYDSVRLDTLERWIREEADSEKGWIITLLFYLLNQWNRRNTGLHSQMVGLPQDALADCSRILSNYYLQRYDKFAALVCIEAGALYFRYADDQMILLTDPSKIEGLLLLLTRQLDRYGLRVNQKKVDIWRAAELKEHRFQDIQTIFKPKKGKRTSSEIHRFAAAYLAIPKDELEKSWNAGMPLLNRLVWLNLESLPTQMYEEIVERFCSEDYLLRSHHRKLKRVYELNGGRLEPVDLIQRLEDLGRKTVHNAFHYEAFNFSISLGNPGLKAYFEDRLTSLGNQMKGHGIS